MTEDTVKDISNGRPLYQQIVDHLVERIEQNLLRPGDQIPTEQEISEAFGVSRITAVRAVKELETKGLVTRTKGKGSFVTSQSSWHTGGERQSERLSVVTLVLPFQEMLALGVLLGVEQIVKTNGLHTSLRNSTADVRHEREILMQDSENGVGGMIVYPCSSADNIGAFSSLVVRRFPLVIIDRKIRGLDTPFVAVDNVNGAYQATRHLVELGHRDVAFFGDAISRIESEAERLRGYCRALIESRIPVRDDLIIADGLDVGARLDTGSGLDQFGYISEATAGAALDKLFGLSSPPTAIVCINDGNAVQFIKSALKRGIRVPDDLSVVGFDNLPFSAHIEVPLTTVEQPFRLIGERAAAMLMRRIADPSAPYESEILEPRLIVRESTGPPRSGGS